MILSTFCTLCAKSSSSAEESGVVAIHSLVAATTTEPALPLERPPRSHDLRVVAAALHVTLFATEITLVLLQELAG